MADPITKQISVAQIKGLQNSKNNLKMKLKKKKRFNSKLEDQIRSKSNLYNKTVRPFTAMLKDELINFDFSLYDPKIKKKMLVRKNAISQDLKGFVKKKRVDSGLVMPVTNTILQTALSRSGCKDSTKRKF